MHRLRLFTPERVLLLAIVVTVVIYWRDLSYDFLLDDVPLVLTNPALTSWHSLPAIFRSDIFFHYPYDHTRIGSVHYRPVYMTWMLLNARLFGMVLPWWHLTSLLLHAAVTLLVYRAGARIVGDKWLAAFGASLFAVHPIHVESVAYVTASTDILVAFFLLAGILFYFRFREEGGHVADLLISVVSAAAAVMSKESAGMFPWMLVAYEALKQRPDDQPQTWKQYVWTLPYFAVGAAYAVLRTALFGFNAGPGPGGSRASALVDIPLAMLVYVKNLFLPVQLSFFYPAEWSTQWTIAKAVAVLFVAAALMLIWVCHKRRPEVRLLLAWVIILCIPPALALTTFVRDEWVHDRHMYAATVPLCLLLSVLLAKLVRRPRVLAVTGAVMVAVLAVDSWFQVPRFADEFQIYSSAEKIAPQNANLHRYFASALWKYNRQGQALQEFRTVIELKPNLADPHDEYGTALAQIGRDGEALDEYKKALALGSPESEERPQLLYRMAVLETDSSDLDAAAAHLHDAITIAPNALNYHAALANVLRKQGQPSRADQELLTEAVNRKQFLNRRKASSQP